MVLPAFLAPLSSQGQDIPSHLLYTCMHIRVFSVGISCLWRKLAKALERCPQKGGEKSRKQIPRLKICYVFACCDVGADSRELTAQGTRAFVFLDYKDRLSKQISRPAAGGLHCLRKAQWLNNRISR